MSYPLPIRLLALAALLLTCSPLQGAQNLLPNGSFETGTFTGWSGASGARLLTNNPHAGVYVAELTTQTLSATVNLPPGQPAKLTAWIRFTTTAGNDQGWGGFRLETLTSDWKSLAHSGWLLQRTHGSNWFKVALQFTPATSQTRLQIGYFGDTARQMTTLLDDVMAFTKPASNQPPTLSVSLSPTLLDALPASQDFTLTADDPDGAVRRILWDFGDGSRSLSPSGSHHVGFPGTFTARATVSDDDGATTVHAIEWTASASSFPLLAVQQPQAETTTNVTPSLQLSGTVTTPGAAVRLSSDRHALATAAFTNASQWSASLDLAPGWNRILIQAQDTQGRVTTRERRVRYLPPAPLAIELPPNPAQPVPRWESLEIPFTLLNCVATHPQFPYDPQPPPGLDWVDGVSVDAEFTPDNWRTILPRPAFVLQPYSRASKGGEEWMYPTNAPRWTVRFAPPRVGAWRYRIHARDARSQATSSEGAFLVSPSANLNNHGPIRVAPLDSRYFEYADGTTFLGGGHNTAFSSETYSLDADAQFAAIGEGNQQFFRWWIAGHLWGSAWQPWNSRTLGYNGTVPKTGLALESACPDRLASFRLDAANPIMFQGWMSGHAGLLRNRTYLACVRWRTHNITGPASPGSPFGLCAKLTGWPEPGQTISLPTLVPHASGTTPWHVATGSFTATTDLLPNFTLVLENTTGGSGYIDEIRLHEVLPNGALGPQLLRSPAANAHLQFDARRGAGLDAILAAAERLNASFKLNISEKQEELLNWLGPDGLPDPLGGHFNDGPGTPSHRLHEYYWRHLFARFGASRAIHSWELVNEEDPNNLTHFRLAADLADAAGADGNPHLATTSTWSSFAPASWNHPDAAPLAYADFHAYVRSTGEITPKDELARDSARFFHEYDLAARAQGYAKPVVWGEMGIDGTNGSDNQDPLLAQDTTGVWLHKIIWARTGPGGLYPLYWYTDNIRTRALHFRFGAWNRFLRGIPLHNGRYQDAAAASSHPQVRVLGQKDLVAERAHLWIDHQLHTWSAVVAGSNIPPASATLSLQLARPGTPLQAVWFNTATGQPQSTNSLTANPDGSVSLAITNLVTDTAVRIEPAAPSPTAPRFEAIQAGPDGVYLGWHADTGSLCRVHHRSEAGPGAWSAQPEDVFVPGTRGECWIAPPLSSSQVYRLELR